VGAVLLFSATLAFRRRLPLVPLLAGAALIDVSNVTVPALGLAATSWYDHKRLDRVSPELIEYIDHTVDHAVAERTAHQ
jgi:hypothetical protein